jgi:formylglycine-generating enzyme required for sulfatase activity
VLRFVKPPAQVTLVPGQPNTLEVELEPQSSVAPIRVLAEDLPAGVKMAAKFDNGKWSLEVTAAPGAATTARLARLVAVCGNVREEAPWWITVGSNLPREITNSIGMKLVLIPAGHFRMGSPATEKGRGPDEEQHEVEITRPFYLGACEVTQEEYQKVMNANPSHFSAKGKGKDMGRLPVESVSWEEAVEFCRKLSKRPQEGGSRTYRLPTEAEWERACRGGVLSHQVFHFGNSLSSEQANFDGREPYSDAAPGQTLSRTTPVGSYGRKNPFRLLDMHGNVWEWCSDWYNKDHPVLRGGSWKAPPRQCRSASRRGLGPGERADDVGFRVVLAVGAP